MTRAHIVAALALTAAALTTTGGVSARPQPAEDVQLAAAIEGAPKAGTPVLVRIKLENKGTGPVTVAWDTVDPFRVTVVLKDKAGREVPLTRYGKRSFGIVEKDEPLLNRDGSIRSVAVAAKTSYDLSIDNLALYYDLTLPGEYVLTASADYAPGDNGAVGSKTAEKTVRFQISP